MTAAPGALTAALGSAHGRLVHGRRVRALSAAIARHVPPGARIVDVGCGDGALGALVAAAVPGATVEGFEVAPRAGGAIPVRAFDGRSLPLEDGAADVAMLVDVLHHTDDPLVLLREARRVARRAVILKDHRLGRPLAGATLRLMDWVGNRAHGVALPYNYWPEARWRAAFEEVGLGVAAWDTALGLYPAPFGLLFERGLHFVARLEPGSVAR